ncbi:MAG TPA: hypothetical protein VII94_03920 [Candidatus Saccharimonadales bacterium]
MTWPAKWKVVTIAEVAGFLEVYQTIDISLLKKGCEMCNVPFRGGGTYFFQASTPEEEMKHLEKQLTNELQLDIEYVIAYAKELKPHSTLAFYKVIAICSNDVLDLKKALKIQKLKAFL